MAAISTARMNIVEWTQHFHRGRVLPEIKMLSQDNAILSDIPFMMCNDGTTHLYNLNTLLPTVAKTAYGEGTPESKSSRAQERETCTMLTGFSTIEEDLGQLYGGMGAVRAQEDEYFSESLKQQFARSLIYDNRALSLKDIYGLATRYNQHTNGVKAKNTLTMGGSAANAQTSMYFVNWGPDAYGVFPEGTTAGYQRIDLGRQVKTLSSGNQLVVRQTKHLWHIGLVIAAWQSAGRICNIQVASAADLGGTMAPGVNDLLNKIVQIRMRFRRPGKLVGYANDTTYQALMRIGMAKSASAVTVQTATTQFGEFEELKVFNTPIRRCDQIVDAEAVVGS